MPSQESQAPDGIVIIENYLRGDVVEKLKYFADGQIGILNKEEISQQGGSLTVRQNEGLVSERIYVRKIHGTAIAICDEIFGKTIPEHYGATIEWYEYPHIIRYRKGGKYIPHADADAWPDDRTGWVRNVERDFSAVAYFNDEFEGGCLYFPKIDFRITPKPGMLVCFPSDSRYVHTAEPVITGKRYAFVTWAAAIGTERIFDNPRGDIVYVNRTNKQ